MAPKTKTVLFILGSFLLGGVAGGWLVGRYGGPMIQQRRSQSHSDFFKSFSERLKLDPRQSAVVDSIITYHRNKMNQRRKDILAVRDTLRVEVRKQLNPEQNKLYDDFIREIDEREARQHNSEAGKR